MESVTIRVLSDSGVGLSNLAFSISSKSLASPSSGSVNAEGFATISLPSSSIAEGLELHLNGVANALAQISASSSSSASDESTIIRLPSLPAASAKGVSFKITFRNATSYSVDSAINQAATAAGSSGFSAEDEAFMSIAIEEALVGPKINEGGPFGACIVRDGEIIARAHNMVVQTNDPTMHAEVTCIRKACAKLGRFDLSDCTIYSSCEPCPMCFGAIHWAKLKSCLYAATAADASQAGYDDSFIYDVIRGTNKEVHVHMQHMDHPESKLPFTKKFQLY